MLVYPILCKESRKGFPAKPLAAARPVSEATASLSREAVARAAAARPQAAVAGGFTPHRRDRDGCNQAGLQLQFPRPRLGPTRPGFTEFEACHTPRPA